MHLLFLKIHFKVVNISITLIRSASSMGVSGLRTTFFEKWYSTYVWGAMMGHGCLCWFLQTRLHLCQPSTWQLKSVTVDGTLFVFRFLFSRAFVTSEDFYFPNRVWVCINRVLSNVVFWIRLFFLLSLTQHIFLRFILEKVCTPPTTEICILGTASSLPLNQVLSSVLNCSVPFHECAIICQGFFSWL